MVSARPSGIRPIEQKECGYMKDTRTFEEPKLEIVEFAPTDIIRTSGEDIVELPGAPL